MLLSEIECEGCGRRPSFREWFRAEFGHAGYENWRHPGVVFTKMGCPLSYATRAKAMRLYEKIFSRPLPDEPGLLCPECQERCEALIPELSLLDTGPSAPADADASAPPERAWFGRQKEPG